MRCMKFIKNTLHNIGMKLIRYARKHAAISTQGDITCFQFQGSVTVNIPHEISSVGITNLTEVVEHQITTIVGSRSHMVRFHNGGVLQFAYNSSGQLIELKSQGLAAIITSGSEVSYAIPQVKLQDDVIL